MMDTVLLFLAKNHLWTYFQFVEQILRATENIEGPKDETNVHCNAPLHLRVVGKIRAERLNVAIESATDQLTLGIQHRRT